jgi:trimethylamine---corrinoid protein Co-methyltransferase
MSSLTNGRQLHLSVLTDEETAAIHFATLEILERTGVFVELDRAKEILRGAGGIVDGDRVRIPSFIVDSAVAAAPNRVVVCNRGGERCLFFEGNRTFYAGVGDCPQVLDPVSRSLRPFTSADYGLTAKAIDASHYITAVGCGGNASDYPAEVRQQVAFKYSMLNMSKTFLSHPLDAHQMADVFEMASVIAGGTEALRRAPFVIATAEPTSPLSLFKDATEILLLAAAENMPLVWYPMPSAGTTAPATPAATVASGNAEVLAGLVLHQLARPGAPFIYGTMSGMTDMRSTQWAYGSPDLALLVAANTDMAHSYGLPMFGTAGCTDAIRIDEQAAAEATMLCLMAQLSGANLVHDVGIMGGGAIVSPELIVLCDELIEMVNHATCRISVESEELALDLIDQIGPQGNYLTSDHTLSNFRRFWHSSLFLRPRLAGATELELEPFGQRLNRRTREIIATHKVDSLPAETLRDLDDLEQKWMAPYAS